MRSLPKPGGPWRPSLSQRSRPSGVSPLAGRPPIPLFCENSRLLAEPFAGPRCVPEGGVMAHDALERREVHAPRGAGPLGHRRDALGERSEPRGSGERALARRKRTTCATGSGGRHRHLPAPLRRGRPRPRIRPRGRGRSRVRVRGPASLHRRRGRGTALPAGTRDSTSLGDAGQGRLGDAGQRLAVRGLARTRRLHSKLDNVPRLVLLGVVDEEVAVLDLAKKSNGYELFAEREAAFATGPERHANEVRREEPIFRFLVAQVRQSHRPVADRLEARRGEAAVRVHRHVELGEDQDRTSRGVTCTATASPTPRWSRVTAPVLSPCRSRVTATSAARLRLGQSVPLRGAYP